MLFDAGREVVVGGHLRRESLFVEVVDLVEDNVDPVFQVAARLPVDSVELSVELHHRILSLRVGPGLPVSHKFQDPVLHQDHPDFLGGKPFRLEVLQVFVNPAESEVDGVFAFVVHANADEDFDSEGLVPEFVVPRLSVHLAELVDHTVGPVDFPEVAHFGSPLVVVLGGVVGVYWAGVDAEGTTSVVDLLLEDSGRGVDVQSGVPRAVLVEFDLHPCSFD